MNKLLIISGPTATGKTDLAVKFAKKYDGELVSGDSCQIYREMDIGTGKDQPDKTPIHLINIINPNQKFSVAQFKEIGLKTIKEIQSRGKLPILVGCSGFYIDSIINPNYNTFSVKQNKLLRFILKRFSVKSLQKFYKFLDKNGFFKLNHSDINNHYRLSRKIEIKLFQKKLLPKKQKFDFNILHISLTAPLDFLYERIDLRVDKRMEIGFLDEIKKLLKKYKWSDQGFQIAAYKCLRPYFEYQKKFPFRQKGNPEGKGILEDCLQKWCYAEHSDARRQSCWFKSKSNALFFNITSKNYLKNIFNKVDKWYTKL
ncbi:MAG: tRNA (adenosine(37)-N6)-dimethylallyltransferase MiaA [Candidatus Shapirobacteria bacterium]|nr:tRNA (adenosine(37)-N6)-dimethylallyltransferase MiaA [Candidatus Shapirobacteria bacterium]